MVADKERREVAKALREANFYMSYRSKREMWDELRRIIGEYNDRPFGGVHTFARLADLIDPDESGQNQDTNPDNVRKESPAVQKAPKCDRDALLALADELDTCAVDRLNHLGEADRLPGREYAERIREALGVDDG